MIFKDNRSQSGCLPWDKVKFEQLIKRKFNVSVTLPAKHDTSFFVSSSIKIIPTEMVVPSYNNKYQQLQGPFYHIDPESGTALGTYNVVDIALNVLKFKVKEQLAKIRYEWEVSGVSMTINGTKVSVPTNREERGLFLQALQLGSEPIEWKFALDRWVVLSKENFQEIVQTIVSHVQKCFLWESSLVKTIDSLTTREELQQVSLIPPLEEDDNFRWKKLDYNNPIR